MWNMEVLRDEESDIDRDGVGVDKVERLVA